MSVVGRARERVARREKRIGEGTVYYKRVFHVTSNDPKDDPNIILEAFGLPRYGYAYVTEKGTDPNALCKNINCIQTSHLTWDVECEYDFKIDESSGGGGGGGGSDLPEFEPPTYTWGGTQIREVVVGQSVFTEYQDPSQVVLLSADGIVNSAYEPYNPPAEIDRLIPTLTFERNEPVFNHRYMLWYVNSVNKQKWYGWKPRTVKIASITGNLQFKKLSTGVIHKYWKVKYELQFNVYTWDLFLLDIGSYYFEGGTSTSPWKKVPFMAKGVPTLGLLTADGDKSTTISRYNRFRVLAEMNFNRLMIPMIR